MTAISPTYRLSDAQWFQIKDFLPANGHRGGQWHDHRLLIRRHPLGSLGRWTLAQLARGVRPLANRL